MAVATATDVLNVLADSAVVGLDFYVGMVRVRGAYFVDISDHIKAGNILIIPGSDSMAYYHPDTDTLEMPNAVNSGTAGLLLHECTHALVDINNMAFLSVRRHINECAAYLTQKTFEFRKTPGRAAPAAVPTTGNPWDIFWAMLENVVWKYKLQTTAGNNAFIASTDLDPLILQMQILPGGLVNGAPSHPYGYGTDEMQVSDGLKNDHLFLSIDDAPEETSTRSSSVSMEAPFDPSDDYLIRVFNEHYAKSNAAGYGGRLKRLRHDFAFCSVQRARLLLPRLSRLISADKVSEAFYSRISQKGREALVAVLKQR